MEKRLHNLMVEFTSTLYPRTVQRSLPDSAIHPFILLYFLPVFRITYIASFFSLFFFSFLHLSISSLTHFYTYILYTYVCIYVIIYIVLFLFCMNFIFLFFSGREYERHPKFRSSNRGKPLTYGIWQWPKHSQLFPLYSRSIKLFLVFISLICVCININH